MDKASKINWPALGISYLYLGSSYLLALNLSKELQLAPPESFSDFSACSIITLTLMFGISLALCIHSHKTLVRNSMQKSVSNNQNEEERS